MNKLTAVIIACLILTVVLGGFSNSYINNVYQFYKTKNELESLGFMVISARAWGMEYPYLKDASVMPVVDFASFVSLARNNGSAYGILEYDFSFYIVTSYSSTVIWRAYEYTPKYSVWWVWG